MQRIPEISPADAKKQHRRGTALFLDIRDPGSYAAGHIPGALSLSDANVRQVVGATDKAQRIIIYCYHGNSSRGATAFFLEQGFESVSSMQGGFEHWRGAYPDDVTF